MSRRRGVRRPGWCIAITKSVGWERSESCPRDPAGRGREGAGRAWGRKKDGRGKMKGVKHEGGLDPAWDGSPL